MCSKGTIGKIIGWVFLHPVNEFVSNTFVYGSGKVRMSSVHALQCNFLHVHGSSSMM